jgi:hypothetical protein
MIETEPFIFRLKTPAESTFRIDYNSISAHASFGSKRLKEQQAKGLASCTGSAIRGATGTISGLSGE